MNNQSGLSKLDLNLVVEQIESNLFFYINKIKKLKNILQMMFLLFVTVKWFLLLQEISRSV